MNRYLNNGTDINKNKTIMVFLFLMLFAFWRFVLPPVSAGELEPLSKEELAAVTGTGAVDFSIIGDTARIYFDVHVETYMEIDSLKLGYYQRDNLTTRKFLAPEDPMIIMSGDEKSFELWPYYKQNGPQVPVYERRNLGTIINPIYEYYIDRYADAYSGRLYGEPATISVVNDRNDIDGAHFYNNTLPHNFHEGDPNGPYISYVYWENQGTANPTPHYVPYTDSSKYQYKYNDTLDAYADGRQGDDYGGFLGGLAGIDWFAEAPEENQNNMDWDINIENLRFGTHGGNPMVIDGLVIHLKYDDITSPNKKLTDIIIGSNYLEGSFFGDFNRITGYLNPKLPHSARVGALNTFGFIDIFNEAPVPVSMKRDSFLWMVDHYKMTYEDLDPGLDDKIYYAAPWDPTNNDIRTGFFLRLGLDPNDTEHFGYSLIAGFNEIVANAYEPQGEMLQDSLYNWWNGPNM